MADLVLQAEIDRPHIGIEHPVVEAGLLFGQRRARLLIAGIIEGDVEPAVIGNDGAMQGLDLGGLGEVGCDKAARRADLGKGFDRLLSFGAAAAGDHDEGAAAPKRQRAGTADAVAPPVTSTTWAAKSYIAGRLGVGQACPLDDRPLVEPCRQRAVDGALVTAETRHAEGIGERLRRMTNEQAGL